MKHNNQSLSKTVKDLMFAEPFYGIFLLGLNKRWDDSIETACVGSKEHSVNFDLRVNPDYWNSLVPEHRMGLLKHELLHIAYCHLTDFIHLNGNKGETAKIANYAMDLEINQWIDPTWLPDGGLVLEKFNEQTGLNLEEKKGTIYYYNKLLEAQKHNNQTLSDMLKADMGGEDSITLPDGTVLNLPNHDWKEVREADDATLKVMKAQTVRAMNEAVSQAKSRGTIPGNIEELLKDLNFKEPPKFDWKGYVKRFTGKSAKIYTRKSRRKLNKRYFENPGLKIKQRKHVLVGVDTSMSVNKRELKEFLEQIYHLYKTGNDVTIAQADTAIKNIAPYNPRSEYEVYGRGGTSFNPVVDYFEANRKKYSCLIYFTDGEAPAPRNGKSDLLWVLSSGSHFNEQLPGKVIQIEN
jgi:predicted metal-dependent peptidase